MKRTLAIILSACMLFALISCDFDSLLDETTTKKEKATSDAGVAETTTKPNESTDPVDDTTIKKIDTTTPKKENTTVKSGTTATPVTTKTPETTAPPVSNKVTITEQVLLDYNGFKVTAKSFNVDGFWGPEIKILVENNTSKNISLICDEAIINNYMIDDFFTCSVAAGKKLNETIDFMDSDLEAAGIKIIGQIELYLSTHDKDTYQTIYEQGCVTIKTSAYEKMQITKQDQGAELLNKDGIRIVGKYSEQGSILGKAVVLFIENNTNKNVSVRVRDLSVNGFMIDSFTSCTVFSEKMAMTEITLLDSYLEENDITSVKTIEFKFRVVSSDSYDTLFDSEIITINVN